MLGLRSARLEALLPDEPDPAGEMLKRQRGDSTQLLWLTLRPDVDGDFVL